ncbi:MAG: ABC transporter permease [Deltaproteobacteria bacterium]|jgi:lipoprotein-releasing system permease protein|nr:ABC transporter permease [Deltaproteobacteria bacterium]
MLIFNKIETFIALRYLKSKRKEVFISIITVISVLGVAISVLVLNIALGIMTGLESELQIKLVDANAHVLVRQYGANIRNYTQLAQRIASVKGVVGVTPYTQSQAMISTPHGSHGLLVRGVNDDLAARAKIEKLISGNTVEDASQIPNDDNLVAKIAINQLFAPAKYLITRPDGTEDEVELPPLLIGAALKNSFSLREGDPVTVIAPSFTASPQGAMPKLRRFLITSIYHSGLKEYESGVAYTSLESAQRFFDLSEQVSGIEVFVESMLIAEKVANEINHILNSNGLMYQVLSWKDLNRPLWEALKMEKQVYFIVLLLLIMIASFSIVSTLVMVVMEKNKDIAILKSIGISNCSVLKIFLLQGIIIGAIGTVLGTILGYLGCIGLRAYGFPLNPAVFAMDKVPVYLVPENFIIVAVSAFLITSLSGIYPACRAAKLNVAEVLRYE